MPKATPLSLEGREVIPLRQVLMALVGGITVVAVEPTQPRVT